MSAVQQSNTIGLTGLSSEYSSASDTSTTNSKVASSEQNSAINKSETRVNTLDKVTDEVAETPELSAEQLEKVAQQMQDFVGDLNRNIEFSVDEDSGRDVIKVIDKESGDLLKQYPSEEVLNLVAKLSDMVGGFVDTKV